MKRLRGAGAVLCASAVWMIVSGCASNSPSTDLSATRSPLSQATPTTSRATQQCLADAKALTEAMGVFFAAGHELSISKKQESDYAAYRQAAGRALRALRQLDLDAMWSKDLADARAGLSKIIKGDLAQSTSTVGSAENEAGYREEHSDRKSVV